VLRVRGRATDSGRIRMGRYALGDPTRSTIRVTGRLGGRAWISGCRSIEERMRAASVRFQSGWEWP
jgi:hypothetical protein